MTTHSQPKLRPDAQPQPHSFVHIVNDGPNSLHVEIMMGEEYPSEKTIVKPGGKTYKMVTPMRGLFLSFRDEGSVK